MSSKYSVSLPQAAAADRPAAAETKAMPLDQMSATAQRRASMIQAWIEARRRFYETLYPHRQQLFYALMRLHEAGRGMGGRVGAPHMVGNN